MIPHTNKRVMVYNSGMEITRPFENTDIIVLKNFSTKEEAKVLYDHLSSVYLSAINRDESLKRDDLAQEALEIINRLQEKYVDFAKKNLTFAVEPKFSTLKNYVYWGVGDDMLPHYDNISGDHSAPVMYGCVYYLNDDFEGGELWYPNKGVSYTPVAGEMIINPGNREYSHGVKLVTKGLRISAGSFITQKDQSDEQFGFEY